MRSLLSPFTLSANTRNGVIPIGPLAEPTTLLLFAHLYVWIELAGRLPKLHKEEDVIQIVVQASGS